MEDALSTPYAIPRYSIGLIREGAISIKEYPTISCSREFADVFGTMFEQYDREHFSIACIDAKHKIIGFHTIAVGTLTQSLSILEKCSRPLSFFRVQSALFFTITLRATPRQVEKIVNSRNDSNKPANCSAFTSSITSSSERTTDTTVWLMRDSSPATLPHSFSLPFVLPETTLTKWSLLTDIEEDMISGVVGRGIRSTEATIGGGPRTMSGTERGRPIKWRHDV